MLRLMVIFLAASLMQLKGAQLFTFPGGKNIQLGKFNEPQLITWKFKNTSTKNLRITRFDASCSCIESQWPKVEIKPGQEVEINSLFDPSGFQAGKIKKYALLYISPGNKLANVSFEGIIDRDLDFKPISKGVPLKPLLPGEHWSFSTEIILKPAVAASFKLLGVRAKNDGITSRLEGEGEKLKLNIRSKEPTKFGPINEVVSIDYELQGKKYSKSYALYGHSGNTLLTHNRLVRVKLSSKEPGVVRKKLKIQFPEMLDIKSFNLEGQHGEKASFSLEDKTITVTLKLPEKVLKKDFTGKVVVKADNVTPAILVYLIQK